jgi:bifunctional UDP-N-acetylglucosamine pyrophosphorylase/glucosamine-1-phosphate N-acetyltransferase
MGKRMQSDLPKVLQPLLGKPLIDHVIKSLNAAGVDDIVVVVGYRGETVQESLGNQVRYAWQHEQLGTGHAVLQAEEALKDFQGNVIVACGDVPLIKSETFRRLVDTALEDSTKAVVLTMDVDDPTGYGRIVTDENGSFQRIVEEKDASHDEKSIQQVNTGTYVFDKHFLFEGLKHINTDNAQGEYYLPDALNYILKAGYSVKTVSCDDPLEGSGVNTKADLQELEDIVTEKSYLC